MQLCAHDTTGAFVFAHKARKQQDYVCIECGDTIRLRSGIHRQPHFYHITPNGACRLNGKGMPHIMTQNHLLKILPEGEAALEHRFPEINRIADVAWLTRGLIFEIQCSPISAEEVEARNASYRSVGFQVVWILHDTRYNQKTLSAAEDFLWRRHHPHYFTNIDDQGVGNIYDHPFLLRNGRKIFPLPPSGITLSSPTNKPDISTLMSLSPPLPNTLYQRAKTWPLFFKGDYIDCCLTGHIDATLAEALENLKYEENYQVGHFGFNGMHFEEVLSMPLSKAISIAWKWWVVRPYIAVIKLMLERACR